MISAHLSGALSFCLRGEGVCWGHGFVSLSQDGDVMLVDAIDYAGLHCLVVEVDLRDAERAVAEVARGTESVRVRGRARSSAMGLVSSGTGAAGLIRVSALGSAVVWLTHGPWRAVMEVDQSELPPVTRCIDSPRRRERRAGLGAGARETLSGVKQEA